MGQQVKELWKENTKSFEVVLLEKADTGEVYGYFEHHEHGDGYGGGLWFIKDSEGKLELTDYDGVAELPKQVYELLKVKGIVMDDVFAPDPPTH